LITTLKKYIKRNVFSSAIKETHVVEAYDIWAENYDAQPGNLMLDLDALLLPQLMKGLNIGDKQVADIGCGTGRHWDYLFKQNPASLTGFDVSPGMLNKLQLKFPEARTHVITDDEFLAIADNSYDAIISTLTVAHIKNIETALTAWSRILKTKGDIIITDFHPNALALGGQRTFKHNNTHIAVENYVHTTDVISSILLKFGFEIISYKEIKVDDTVKHYYEAQDALHVYEKFKGRPIIYGLHCRRA
jgi:ubiquinone/menaquinone biosynthesis C-methylase UbiE